MTTEQERVAIAERAMMRKAAVISGNRIQPKIVWSLAPLNESELRALVTADGNAPLLYLNSILLPRAALMFPGAPVGAQYAWLVMVEVKALFVDP